jgi:excisionase family DNA binding protein
MSEDLSLKVNMNIENGVLLRGGDVARILNISRSQAYQLIQRKKIPAVHIGRSVRVRSEDLHKFISENLTG